MGRLTRRGSSRSRTTSGSGALLRSLPPSFLSRVAILPPLSLLAGLTLKLARPSRSPLAPNSCASVGIRFLAIRPGPHVVDALRVVDVADGSETRLERPLWVVVE